MALPIVASRSGGAAVNQLQQVLERILELQDSYDSSATPLMKERGELIRHKAAERVESWMSGTALKVAGSDGTGRKAQVPWLRVFDPDHSAKPTEGWYIVYLFAADGSAVFLSLNQGTTTFTGGQYVPRERREITANAEAAREALPDDASSSSRVTKSIKLEAASDLGRGYEAGNVIAFEYRRNEVPDDAQLREDLNFLANLLPAVYPIGVVDHHASRSALAVYISGNSMENYRFGLPHGMWGWKRLSTDCEGIEAGDLLILASGFTGGSPRKSAKDFAEFGFSQVDICEVTAAVAERTDPFWPDEVATGSAIYPFRIQFRPLESLRGISVTDLDAHVGGDVGDALRVSASSRSGVIVNMKRSPVSTPTATNLVGVVEAFAAACRDANLDYGQRHLPLVRTFITSLATKRFVILTGLSGSGKTRLALALGQWFGNDYSAVIPVRPDWTSPDALFGYENGLSPEVDGNHAWHVPGALEFMLRAAGDPSHPYLLILDEMNLAHVERYFADVLSGIESEEPILPNLRRNESGEWRPVGSRLKLPSNLFVVGTVNVDETTYMFSPKVLDRANTIEFRVQTEDLAGVPESVEEVAVGSGSDVASFLATASERPDLASAAAEVGDDLRDLHRLLARDGREFGHRTFYEALRFTALHQLAGDDDPRAALDLQVLQKVLPKFHGSVREIKEPLTAVAAWAFFGPGTSGRDGFDPLSPPADTEPALPRTFEKSARMLRRLRDNHFVSFTE